MPTSCGGQSAGYKHWTARTHNSIRTNLEVNLMLRDFGKCAIYGVRFTVHLEKMHF